MVRARPKSTEPVAVTFRAMNSVFDWTDVLLSGQPLPIQSSQEQLCYLYKAPGPVNHLSTQVKYAYRARFPQWRTRVRTPSAGSGPEEDRRLFVAADDVHTDRPLIGHSTTLLSQLERPLPDTGVRGFQYCNIASFGERSVSEGE